MRKRWAIGLLICALLWCGRAHATTPLSIVGDPLAEYATGSVSAGSYPPYNINLAGNLSSGTITVTSISSPPWNPNNAGSSSVYFKTTTSGITGGGTGLGIYSQPGNPQNGMQVGFWFKQETSGSAEFFFRVNGTTGGIYGGDNTAWSMDGSNHITVTSGSGFTTSATLDTAWHFLELCLQNGSSNSTGSTSIAIDGTGVLTQTGINGAAGGTYAGALASFNFDNETLGGGQNVDFGSYYEEDIGSAACPQTTRYPFYSASYVPTANKSPNQWTPSTGTNWQVAAGIPPGNAGHNSDATVGQQDCYKFGGFDTAGTGIVFAMVGTSVAKDALGARLTMPLFNNGSTLGGGQITNLGSLTNGTYGEMFDAWLNSPFSSSAWAGSELQYGCVQVNN